MLVEAARVTVPVPSLVRDPAPLITPSIEVIPVPVRVSANPPFVTLATTEKRLEELFVHP